MNFSSLPKIGAFTVLTLSLAACSSGSHSSHVSTTPIPAAEKAAAEKAAAEKAAAEKAAAEKTAAEKAAAEKTAAEKAAAEKAAAEKAMEPANNLKQANKAKDLLAKQNNLAQAYTTPTNEPQFVNIDENSTSPTGVINRKAGTQLVYAQTYSMTVGTYIDKFIKDDINQIPNGSTQDIQVAGAPTKQQFVPNEGKAIYTGLALGNMNINGYYLPTMNLTYSIDFTKKTGNGYLLGGLADAWYDGKINLDEGKLVKTKLNNLDVMGITSTATSLDKKNGTYKIGLFGPEAQEIAGTMQMPILRGFSETDDFSLGGSRGEIIK